MQEEEKLVMVLEQSEEGRKGCKDVRSRRKEEGGRRKEGGRGVH